MTHHLTKNDYHQVKLSRGKGGNTRYINRLVYRAFGKDKNNMKGLQVDHWDGDKDNNHISNLRVANPSQNLANRNKHIRNNYGLPCSSNFIGTGWHKTKKKWYGNLQIGTKKFYLGGFKHEKNAAWVYNQIAKHFKDSEF